jgi:hypothetical protein
MAAGSKPRLRRRGLSACDAVWNDRGNEERILECRFAVAHVLQTRPSLERSKLAAPIP